MKIVLAAVNAKYIHSNLAVFSLQAYARDHGQRVDLMEFTINQQKDVILRKIFRENPGMLCISCYVWNISYVKELIRDLHKILPDMIIWVGGPEVSYDAEKVLEECPEITGVMKGEGEKTFLELISCYRKGYPAFDEIPGITYRDREGRIRDNLWRQVMDLSEVSFVYRDLQDFKNRIIYYESSRGCPFSCSYCLSSVDKRLRFRSLDLVEKELQFFLDHQVPQVKFVDRTFNCDPRRAAAIWKYLIDHDNGITNFHFEVAADLLTEEELDLIAAMRPGMIQLEIGVQSTNPETIREIHRKMDFEKVSQIVRRIQKHHNVHQHLDLIAGLPGEDYESFARSFNDVYALRPQQLQLGFLKVLKGSYMYANVEAYGCVYQEKEPYEVLETRWLPYADVLRLKLVEEMVEVYYNSGQFLWTLPAAEALFDTAFDFYAALGAFYESHNYLEISHTRIRRYEILLEFLQEKDPGRVDFYRELMICDLYARENMKTRPAWARDPKPYKRQFQEFYRREKEQPSYLKGYEGYDEKQLARMTHLEIFERDPETWEPGPVICLFTYQNRDPLTGSGQMQRIVLPESRRTEEMESDS